MHRRNRLIILASILLPLLAFVFSVIGFAELRHREAEPSWGMHSSSPGEEIYQAVRVFKIQDYRGIAEMPVSLQIGRALALLSILMVTGSVTAILLRQTLIEIAVRGFWCLRIAPEKLIVNLPDDLISLMPELKSEHRFLHPVVLTVASLQGQVAKAAARAGLWVIEAATTEDDFLDLAGVRRARGTFIFGPDSAANLELALACQAEIAACKRPGCKPPSTPPSIHVQVEDPDVQYACQPRAIGREHLASAYIVPFSIPCNAARLIFAGAVLARLPMSNDTSLGLQKIYPDTTYVLCGQGRWLRAVLNELIKTSVVDLEKKVVIHILTPRAEEMKRRFEAEIPAHAQLHAELSFHSVADSEPESFLAFVTALLPTATGLSPWNFLCLLADDGDNLSLASRLRSLVGTKAAALAERSRILFLARQFSSLGQDYTSALNPPHPVLQPIASSDQAASLESITQSPLQKRAALIAEGYDDTTNTNENLWHRVTNGLPKLHALIGVKREQNFAQADHLDIKLHHLGFPPAGQCDPTAVAKRIDALRTATPGSPDAKLLEELAELEHLRWMQVHTLAGYQYAPLTDGQSRHPDDHRLNDCLRPYDELKDEIQQYDRESVLLVGNLVANASGHNTLE